LIVPGLVSVIIPVFNRKEMLLQAVRCVGAQTYRPVELILVNDGSTDGTREVCDRIAATASLPVHVVHRANGGPGAARESGRLVARGEFLQYLDSDDCLEPRKLERQVADLVANPGSALSYCLTLDRSPEGPVRATVSQRTGTRFETIFPALLRGRLWQTVSPLWRRTATDAIGPWSALRNEEDIEYDARAGALGLRPSYCPEALATFVEHSGERASGGPAFAPEIVRSRAAAHSLVYQHARTAGVEPGHPDMAWFARELFLLSRQCGAAGLAVEACRLFGLAREASGPAAGGFDFRLYRFAAGVVGWKTAGAVACAADRFRPSPSAKATV
jgi:GT2 family glycosyltransferase